MATRREHMSRGFRTLLSSLPRGARVRRNIARIGAAVALTGVALLAGAPPERTVYGGTATPARLLGTQQAILSLSPIYPNAAQVYEGQTTSVAVNLDPTDNTVTAVQFNISYTSSVVSVSSQPALGGCGGTVDTSFTNSTGNVRFKATAMSVSGSPCTVATITFTGVVGAKGTSTNLAFVTGETTLTGAGLAIVPSSGPAGLINVLGRITLSPASGPAGSAVSVAGASWGTDPVTLYAQPGDAELVEVPPAANPVTPSGGSFTTTVLVPSGLSVVKGVSGSSVPATLCDDQAAACASYTMVTPTISVSPTQASPGSITALTIIGTNFGSSSVGSAPNNQPA